MDQRISLVTLSVADMARARRFYEEGMGWTPLKTLDEVAFYQLPGLVLALFRRADMEQDAGRRIDGAFSGMALAMNERSPADVDRVMAEAVAAGGRITKPAVTAPWGGYSGYFADPDGHAWEVAWNPQAVIHADGGTTFEFSSPVHGGGGARHRARDGGGG